MIDGNFKKWSREWSNRDDTVKVESLNTIYRDKEDTEDLTIDINETEQCDVYDKYENEHTVHDFVNSQIISYNRNGEAVKVKLKNKILKIV